MTRMWEGTSHQDFGGKIFQERGRCKSPGAHLEYSRSPVSLEHSEEDEELLEIGSERKEGGKIG